MLLVPKVGELHCVMKDGVLPCWHALSDQGYEGRQGRPYLGARLAERGPKRR